MASTTGTGWIAATALLMLAGCAEEPPERPAEADTETAAPAPPLRITAGWAHWHPGTKTGRPSVTATIRFDNVGGESVRVRLTGDYDFDVPADSVLGMSTDPGPITFDVDEPGGAVRIETDLKPDHTYVYNVGARWAYDHHTAKYSALGLGGSERRRFPPMLLMDPGEVDRFFEAAPETIEVETSPTDLHPGDVLVYFERVGEAGAPIVTPLEIEGYSALVVDDARGLVVIQPGHAMASWAEVWADNTQNKEVSLRLGEIPVTLGPRKRVRIVAPEGEYVLSAAVGEKPLGDPRTETLEAGARYVWNPDGRGRYATEATRYGESAVLPGYGAIGIGIFPVKETVFFAFDVEYVFEDFPEKLELSVFEAGKKVRRLFRKKP